MKHTFPLDSTRYVLFAVVIFVTVFLFSIKGAWTADFCVTNATELTNALAVAVTNGEDDTIKGLGKNKLHLLLVFWPGYCVASMAPYNKYETIAAPCIRPKIQRNPS